MKLKLEKTTSNFETKLRRKPVFEENETLKTVFELSPDPFFRHNYHYLTAKAFKSKDEQVDNNAHIIISFCLYLEKFPEYPGVDSACC